MRLKASFRKYVLDYIKPARTSRGEMTSHEVYFVSVEDALDPKKKGWGEAAPLPGLSIDHHPGFESHLAHVCTLIGEGVPTADLPLLHFPSIRFALETAFRSMEHAHPALVFESAFTQGEGIPINGLVWMDTKEEMLKQAEERIAAGYDCIKFKVGAIDFDDECRMLETLRKKYSAFKITLRLDANGAFDPDHAVQQIRDLSRFEIHSIEQPIKAGQVELMAELCAKSKVSVALDEELIGYDVQNGNKLLSAIGPAYIILKPTLLGGFAVCDTWIKHARSHDIGYWATSALESNIGLNAIAQWAATLGLETPQGLGTGSLYSNNIPMPLSVHSGKLYYDAHAAATGLRLPAEEA